MDINKISTSLFLISSFCSLSLSLYQSIYLSMIIAIYPLFSYSFGVFHLMNCYWTWNIQFSLKQGKIMWSVRKQDLKVLQMTMCRRLTLHNPRYKLNQNKSLTDYISYRLLGSCVQGVYTCLMRIWLSLRT